MINHKYDDDSYILESFKKIISNLDDDRNILLYGCGIRTEYLLNSLQRDEIDIYNSIVNVIATERIGEDICGKKIVHIEQVDVLTSAAIIIIARYAVVNTIYRKLETILENSNIEAYDLTGKNLKKFKDYSLIENKYTTEEELKILDVFKRELTERENNKWIIHSETHLARTIFAPVIFKYLLWLIQKIQLEGIEYVLFPSRDGFLLNRIYQSIREKRPDLHLPDSIYFYSSRRSTLIAAAENAEDIKHIAELPGMGNASEKLSKRLGIEIDEDFDENHIPKRVIDVALEHCAQERKNYIDYLNKKGILGAKNSALVDFVAVGSVHEALQRLTMRNYKGYYFLRRYPDSSFTTDLDIDSLYGTYGDFEMDFNLYRYYYFFENIMSSFEPTFKRIGNNGEVIFFNENRTKKAIEILNVMQDAIYLYCEEMFARCSDPLKWNASIMVYDKILGYFSNQVTNIPRYIFEEFENIDEFLEKKVKDCNR